MKEDFETHAERAERMRKLAGAVDSDEEAPKKEMSARKRKKLESGRQRQQVGSANLVIMAD